MKLSDQTSACIPSINILTYSCKTYLKNSAGKYECATCSESLRYKYLITLTDDTKTCSYERGNGVKKYKSLVILPF